VVHGGRVLIVVSGLPGTGKTAVAAALAAELGATHLSVDPVEDALLGAGLPRGRGTGVAAYEAARVVAEQNLALGRTVVVDAVNDSEPARRTWRVAAARAGAGLVFVLLTLDDEDEHRRRLESRVRDLVHVPEPSWDDVRARAAAYEPWAEGGCLRLDAAPAVGDVVAALLDRLPGRGRGGAGAP
jgi:predicted kinase